MNSSSVFIWKNSIELLKNIFNQDVDFTRVNLRIGNIGMNSKMSIIINICLRVSGKSAGVVYKQVI